MKEIKLIVGLANPIKKYNDTRHNVGSWLVNSLVTQQNKKLKKNNKFLGYSTEINILSKNIHVLVPDTFMNLSGISVLAISNFYNIKLHEILVVHDELDLKPGNVKFRLRSSHNGHNGIRNVLAVLGTNIKFLRIQIGIGRPINSGYKISKFVLSKPNVSEKLLINRAILCAIRVIYDSINQRNVIMTESSLNSMLDHYMNSCVIHHN
ncbi:peptidyl-tRNA hydrolase [Buchnera aphidicola str. Bp (Baizongia pistaciae)]|uniref:Peptidyl-tRNA hydrolase n=1 Tax=Buchnera aphidicola subsp. Baizongia pistaciae (strain Bp) TaxID=224915 RepID=PTH_BUCBP|nr:aminoacyl-tRNA hydrolase [Buchnera aphidicola]P59490.1 RecName: Full=Peptidyl-tRNA hydrolase; Short=PTH [Buchnera aphidicola str. Bp (Baizongia pistaciae)]AAO26911.1 peptidyl-tRNA hydrolase [Buchnera aphidicola str. Bp (Baizongia pistaciae)]